MSYLVPSEFVTKMVDAGESKIFMSTRDTLIRAYMAARYSRWRPLAVSVTVADRLSDHRRDFVPGRFLHVAVAGLRSVDRRFRADAAGADRQASGRDDRRRAAQLGPRLRAAISRAR